MWVRFERDFDFSPATHGGRVTIAYKAGTVANVTRECASAAGERAVRTSAPRGREAQASREAPPSVLPDISPSRGEIGGGGVGDGG